MSDTESSARNSDDSDEDVEEEEDEEEEDVDEEESEEGEEEEVEEEEDEEEEDIDDENDDCDTNGEDDGSDESDDGDHDTDESEESDSEKKSTENESEEYSESDEKKMERPKASFKLKDSKKKAKIKTPVKNTSVRNESPDLKHKSDSDEDSNRDDNSESDEQQNGGKEKGMMAKTEIKESIKETEVKVQHVDSVGNESPQLQQKRGSDDEQGSNGKLKGLTPKIETEESKKETKIQPQHVENKSRKIESPVLERKRVADDDSKTNSKSDEQESSVKVKDLAAKAGNKESNEETKIKAQHVESVREESLELQQKSHLATDSDGNDNSKSDQQESQKKVIGHAAKMENKESEKETEIKVQPVKSVRKESPELQRKSYSAKDPRGNDTFDKQEMKYIAAKTESKENKNKTKIMAVQPVEDKSLKNELPELRGISNSENYKSDKQVKVTEAKTEIKESKKETKINTQPVEAESVRKQSSDQANNALPTEKKEAKNEDFSQTTVVPGTYVQVDRCDVISTRRVGTQTKLKHYNVCTFTSGLIKKVNMQTYTSGLISKSDHSTNTIQERGKDKKTQTKDKCVLDRHLTVKDNDSSEKKATDNKDTTKKSDENEYETSVQLKRRKVKVPLLKLSPEEESNSANSTESTEDRPPQPDSLSKKAKDIKSIQKLQKTPIESSGVYTDKEYDKKTRKEKENIRRRGRRRPQLCNFSKRHPSREYIPKPSKNKTLHFRRPTSAGPVYKRELINPIHRPGDSKNKILLVRPNSAGPVHKRQSKQPEGTALSMAQYRMLYHHRWADISC